MVSNKKIDLLVHGIKWESNSQDGFVSTFFAKRSVPIGYGPNISRPANEMLDEIEEYIKHCEEREKRFDLWKEKVVLERKIAELNAEIAELKEDLDFYKTKWENHVEEMEDEEFERLCHQFNIAKKEPKTPTKDEKHVVKRQRGLESKVPKTPTKKSKYFIPLGAVRK